MEASHIGETATSGESTNFFTLGTLKPLGAGILSSLGAAGRFQNGIQAALVHGSAHLPCPEGELDTTLLHSPEAMRLVILAGVCGTVALYVICDMRTASARMAMKSACQAGRLEVCFELDSGNHVWSAMRIDIPTQGLLLERLEECKSRRGRPVAAHGDKLALLLLGLSSQLHCAVPHAPGGLQNLAVLLSGGPEHATRSSAQLLQGKVLRNNAIESALRQR